LYTFSIRQRGDRDGELRGELGSWRTGFTSLIHRSVLKRDLRQRRERTTGRVEHLQGWGV